MRAFALVSKKSGNIASWDEIAPMLCIFKDRKYAEIMLRVRSKNEPYIDKADKFEIKEIEIV